MADALRPSSRLMDTMPTVPANDEQVSNALDFEKNTPSTPESKYRD